MTEPTIYSYVLRHDLLVLVYDWDGKLSIELHAYSTDGEEQGSLFHTLPRDEAVKMANAILKWANGRGQE